MRRIRIIRVAAMMCAVSPLAGCFVSDEPLIPAGEAVLPVDRQITLCPDEEDKCLEMEVSADGYVTKPEFEEESGSTARFSPLMQVNGRQIYILEARDFEDDTYTYLVARRSDANTSSVADLELAMLSCGDLDQTQRSKFEAKGGRIDSNMVTSCRAPNLATLSDTLREAFTEQFSNEAWWTAKGDL